MAFRRIVLIVLVIVNVQISLYHVQGQERRSCPGITRGRRFVIAFTGNYAGNVDAIKLSLLIAAFSDNQTTVTVSGEFPTNSTCFQRTFEIEPRGFHRISIPSVFDLGTRSETSNEVIQVDANSDVSVYGVNYELYTADAFLGIPIDHLGLNYVVMGYQESNSYPPLFAVVGVQDNTTVLANLTGPVTFNGHTYSPGDVARFTINQNEVAQIVATSGSVSLGGTIISSSKPVAVFSGDLCANTPGSACDVLSEQVVPVKSWGTKHIYTASGSSEGRSIYVVHAYYEDTIVNVTGFNPVTLQPGETFQNELIGSGVITTSQPASVVQILSRIGNTGVDPAMIQIPNENQFGYIFGFLTPQWRGGDSEEFINFLNIIVKVNQSSTVMLNNTSILNIGNVSSHQIPGTDYEVFIVQIAAAEAAYFVEQSSPESTSPISVIVYGYDSYESYGYAAGSSEPANERPFNISPFFLSEDGGDQVTISVPDLPVYCRFQTTNGPIDVKGTLTEANTIVCVSPSFSENGFVEVAVSMDGKETFPFRGNVYVVP